MARGDDLCHPGRRLAVPQQLCAEWRFFVLIRLGRGAWPVQLQRDGPTGDIRGLLRHSDECQDGAQRFHAFCGELLHGLLRESTPAQDRPLRRRAVAHRRGGLAVRLGDLQRDNARDAGSTGGEIAAGWELLVPTTHHDFITGTACDPVYYSGGLCANESQCKNPKPPVGGVWHSNGQLSMSNQTVALANDAMSTAMKQLSVVAGWDQSTNFIPLVVFN